MGKGAGSSELPRWHIFLEQGRVGLQRIETWTLWIAESESRVVLGLEEGFEIEALGKVRISFQAEQERGHSVGSPLDPSLLFQAQLLPGQLETCLTQARVVQVQPIFR